MLDYFNRGVWVLRCPELEIQMDEKRNKKLEEMYKTLVENKDIKEYFDLEVKFNIMIADVNKIIAEAIKDVL